ncbi:MOSC domain-containing protein [Thermoflexus sp.]|uniref:MOSC domain-containing protein n=1 Tax=Thermoflexus sp. TaxID=1969742 RepID=UPI0035E4220F
MDYGVVVALFRCPGHRIPMESVSALRVEAGYGIVGDSHAREGSLRQILLMDQETLDALDLPPGAVRENITVRGLPLHDLQSGEHLRVGEALLEITQPCTPCSRMEEIRPGLQEALRGRRGMLARVVESGWIRRGDLIRIESRKTSPCPPHGFPKSKFPFSQNCGYIRNEETA